MASSCTNDDLSESGSAKVLSTMKVNFEGKLAAFEYERDLWWNRNLKVQALLHAAPVLLSSSVLVPEFLRNVWVLGWMVLNMMLLVSNKMLAMGERIGDAAQAAKTCNQALHAIDLFLIKHHCGVDKVDQHDLVLQLRTLMESVESNVEFPVGGTTAHLDFDFDSITESPTRQRQRSITYFDDPKAAFHDAARTMVSATSLAKRTAQGISVAGKSAYNNEPDLEKPEETRQTENLNEAHDAIRELRSNASALQTDSVSELPREAKKLPSLLTDSIRERPAWAGPTKQAETQSPEPICDVEQGVKVEASNDAPTTSLADEGTPNAPQLP